MKTVTLVAVCRRRGLQSPRGSNTEVQGARDWAVGLVGSTARMGKVQECDRFYLIQESRKVLT